MRYTTKPTDSDVRALLLIIILRLPLLRAALGFLFGLGLLRLVLGELADGLVRFHARDAQLDHILESPAALRRRALLVAGLGGLLLGLGGLEQ